MEPDIITSTARATSFEAARIDAGAMFIREVVEDFFDEALGGVSNVTYNGAGFAGFFVEEYSIPGVFDLSGGILLSTGAFPGDVNTQSGFSQSFGTPGDVDLDGVAAAAFGGAGTTFDAATIEFEIVITDPTVDGFSFDLVFGSEEFPEFSDSSFVDVAAVFVNGVNVALFNNNPSQPLSVISENLVNGNFIDNTGGFDDGDFFEGEDGVGAFEDGFAPFATELDGFSDVLTIRAPLVQGTNTIKIGVADTGDEVLDSILYVTNFELLSDGGTGGGVLQVVDGTDGDDELGATLANEEINLIDGMDEVAGTGEELDGDIITGFGEDDTLLVEGETFTTDDLTVTFGSAIIDIDLDGDGDSDTTITLEGDFDGAEFVATQTDEGTEVTFSFAPEVIEVNGTAGRDVLVGTDADELIFGDAGSDLLTGGGGNDVFVFGEETSNGVRDFDIINDFGAGDTLDLGGASIVNEVNAGSSTYLFLDGDFDVILLRGVSDFVPPAIDDMIAA